MSNWQTLAVDGDYEIQKDFPHMIRRKSTKKIVAEKEDFETQYLKLYLNNKPYYKSEVVAQQFVPNPNNYKFIEHVDGNITQDSRENLCWVSTEDGDFVDDISNDSFQIKEWDNHELRFYYYSPTDDKFYWFNGKQYKEVKPRKDYTRRFLVYFKDVDDQRFPIYLDEFKEYCGLLKIKRGIIATPDE